MRYVSKHHEYILYNDAGQLVYGPFQNGVLDLGAGVLIDPTLCAVIEPTATAIGSITQVRARAGEGTWYWQAPVITPGNLAPMTWYDVITGPITFKGKVYRERTRFNTGPGGTTDILAGTALSSTANTQYVVTSGSVVYGSPAITYTQGQVVTVDGTITAFTGTGTLRAFAGNNAFTGGTVALAVPEAYYEPQYIEDWRTERYYQDNFIVGNEGVYNGYDLEGRPANFIQ